MSAIRVAGWILGLALAASSLARVPDAKQAQGEPSFVALDVFVDVGEHALAAWQLEVRDAAGAAKLSGVEGGAHPAFAEPARFDPRAVNGGRVVLAAFQTGAELPHGRTRVATLHFAVDAGATPRFEVELGAAVGRNGETLAATAEIDS